MCIRDSVYVDPISEAIEERGLDGQIDFIGLLGQSERYQLAEESQDRQSLSYGLLQLSQFANGVEAASLDQTPTGIAIEGGNEALRSSTIYENVRFSDGTFGESQYYVSGLIGYTGQFGITADQVIQSLSSSVAADGTNPQGTIYFEENDNIRSCLLYTSPSPRDRQKSRMPSSA